MKVSLDVMPLQTRGYFTFNFLFHQSHTTNAPTELANDKDTSTTTDWIELVVM